jgi:hypothetical protein
MALFVLPGTAPLEAQTQQNGMVTDSVIGTLVEQLPNGFVLRTDDGEDVVLEVASDTIQELQDLRSDTTVTMGPHSGVMDGRDVWFALRQLEESDARKRVLVHYFTLADAARHVVVWLSIAEDRVPGGS